MQNQDAQKANNVVSLFSAREKVEQANAEAPAVQAREQSEEEFRDVIEKNMKNKERLARERANANKSVLRSYRIKH